MADVTRSQAPETEGLLSDDHEPHDPYYRDDPELEINSNMGLGSQADAGRGGVEWESLLESPPQTPIAPRRISGQPEGRRGDTLALALVVSGSALLVVLTWITILSNDPKSLGWFAYHPPLQTLSIALAAVGITTLQPRSQPQSKRMGLALHQFLIYLAFQLMFIGLLAIIRNKVIHESPHFTSWHGKFGLFALVWMMVQLFLGAWFRNAAFGGGDKAKAILKCHRLSGYMLFPFFLVTAHIGGAWSSWMVTNTSQATRIVVYAIAPIAMLIGVWGRARLSKMKF